MRSYRFPQLKEATGLSRSTIFRLERDGKFPKRRHLSTKAVGWLAVEVDQWLQSREIIQGEHKQ